MSTKAKIIIALVVVAIIVGVTIWLYNKKKKEKAASTASAASEAIKKAGQVIIPRTVAPVAEAAAPAAAFDFETVKINPIDL